MVVEGRVEPELLEPGELRGAPGAADHACASPTGELSGEAPDRARRARDEHRLALLHAADVVDPDERRQPRHAEHSKGCRERRRRGVERPSPRRVDESRLAPAEVVDDPGALGERLGRRRDDLADSAPGQRLAQRERRHVRTDVVHATAHVRIDRDERVAHEHLTVHGVGKLDLRELEVSGDGQAARPGGKPDLARPQRHRRILRGHARRAGFGRLLTESFKDGATVPRGFAAMSFAGRSEEARPGNRYLSPKGA